MSGFQYEIQDRNGTKCAEITGYDGSLRTLVVPERIEGIPVTCIGRFALADREDLEEIHLPASVETLQLFAFQNCTHLQRIELYNTTDDYYNGVIRGCRLLSDVTVHCIQPDNYIIIREMLADTDAALTFHLLEDHEEDSGTGGSDARPGRIHRRVDLTFPEYVSETNEDTMARAIHISIEGAGMAYRECVSKHEIDYAGYDQLLPRLTEYDFEAARKICLGRLMYPEQLSAPAAERYETYLSARAGKVVEAAVGEHDADAVRFLTDRELIPEESLAGALSCASEAGETQICGILMEYQHRHFAPSAPESLKLSW